MGTEEGVGDGEEGEDLVVEEEILGEVEVGGMEVHHLEKTKGGKEVVELLIETQLLLSVPVHRLTQPVPEVRGDILRQSGYIMDTPNLSNWDENNNATNVT